MADIQRIVDEVRFRLQSGDCELTPQLEELAREYAALCHDTNHRLRRCGEFLKHGLRAEAMHLAEADPNLLDTFATADFPERAEWDEITALYQLPRPEPLLSAVAEELNEAYAVQKPLEKLLDRHRLLALRRAPLVQRLGVVRKLAQADPDSPFWNDDIRDLEKARMEAIEPEARAAAARGDAEALAQLVAELSGNEWLEPPGPALVQGTRRLALQAIAEHLAAAHTTGRLADARGLRERWQELSAKAAPQIVDGLSLKVGPALKWIAGEDGKGSAARLQREALARLQRKLISAESPEELEQARRDVLKYGDAIPESVSEQVYSRMIELKRQTRSRRRKFAGGLVLGTVAILGLAVFLGRSILKADSAKRVAEAADEMISQGNLAQARQLLEKNDWLATSEPYLAVQVKLAAAEKKTQERVAAFRAAIERARSARTRGEADAALLEADRLAISTDERLVLSDVTTRWKLRSEEAAGDQEDRFQQRLSELIDLLDRAEDAEQKGAGDPAFARLLKTADNKLAELKQMAPHVKASLARHVDAAESRLARVRSNVSHSQGRAELLERLTRTALNLPDATDRDEQALQFGDTLQKYATAFPGDPRAKDFAASANEVALWRGVIDWQQLAGRWQELVPVNVAAAKDRIAECDACLRDFALSPAAPLIGEYQAFLKHFVAREQDESGDEAEGLRAKLRNLFSGPLIDGVHVLELKDGKVYYLNRPLEESEADKFTFRYVAGFNGAMKTKAVAREDLKHPGSREAPQVQICRRLRAAVARARLDSWKESMLEIAETLRSDHELDPFLKYYLLLRTLEYVRAGDSFLGAELEPVVAGMRDQKISLASRWMDPDDHDAARARRDAGEKVRALGDLKALWRRARDRQDKFHGQLFEVAFPVGWLSLDERQQWRCVSSWTPRAECGLWIALEQPGGEPARWSRIGDAHPKAGLALHNDPARTLQEGRLVFVRQTNVPER